MYAKRFWFLIWWVDKIWFYLPFAVATGCHILIGVLFFWQTFYISNIFVHQFVMYINIYIYIYIYIYRRQYKYRTDYEMCVAKLIYANGIHHQQLCKSCYRNFVQLEFRPTTIEPFLDTQSEFHLHSQPALYTDSSFTLCSIFI